MDSLFLVFPNDPVPPFVDRCDGLYIYTQDGRKILDMTAGGTHYAILGWSHPEVLAAMQVQLKKFTHMDYKIWSDPNTYALADLLLTRKEHKLDKVYFCGNSGGEACEAALKMSYQVHFDQGKPNKDWFISRTQSYHGSSTDAIAIGERPNLLFYNRLFPANRAKVTEHNIYRHVRPGESLDQYARRCAKELEDKILELGPDRVSAFIGETIMGGLVGDVPPAPGYWKYMREVCTKYDVHLIMDEVYCGTGTSGKIYCCDWDGVTPDFLCLGKTLAAGYAPVSAVVTSDTVYSIIKRGQGRLQHTTTHQAYSLGIAAALAVQKVIHNDTLLTHVTELGAYMRKCIEEGLGGHPFFKNVRGRGLRFAVEYACRDMNDFGTKVSNELLERNKIFVSGKWHRFSITPALLLTKEQADLFLENFIATFKRVAATW